MRPRAILCSTVAAFAISAIVAWAPTEARAQTVPTIGATDLGGVVRGPGGPEAGVWVVAETTDLPTKFAKMVVTDDQGRYVIPELPKAKYKVWVRGYGLVDSAKVDGEPGNTLNLNAVPAPELIASTTNWSSSLPAKISSHALTIALALSASSALSSLFASAAERLIMTKAFTRLTWAFWPVTLYWWIARAVNGP